MFQWLHKILSCYYHFYIYSLLLDQNSMPCLTKKNCTHREIWARFIEDLSKHSLQNKVSPRLLRFHESFVQQRYIYSCLPVPWSNWANYILPQYNDDCWQWVMWIDSSSYCIKIRSSFIAVVIIEKLVGCIKNNLHVW